MYLNHVQLIGFLGKDPEQRKARSNGINFLVLSLATQQSWKDDHDEWQSRTEWHRIVAFNRLAEAVAGKFHKGDHLLVEGMLVSTKYEREGKGKGKKAKAVTQTYWNVRATSIRKLNRGEQGPETAPAPTNSSDAAEGDGMAI